VKADAWPDSILAAPYPKAGPTDEGAERAFGPVIGIVDAIRNIRGEMNIPFKVALADVEVGSLDPEAEATVREELARIQRLANLAGAIVRADRSPPAKRGASAVAVGAGFEVRVGLEGAIDLAAESARIDKEIAKLDQDLAGILKKLENPSFVAKAPAEVVEKDRTRAEELREKRGKLQAHRAMLSGTLGFALSGSRQEEAMENRNPQDPNQPASPDQSSGTIDTMEKIATTAVEVGKAAANAVVAGMEEIVDKVMPGRRKPAARKPAARKPAAKKKVAKKTTARRAAPKAAGRKAAGGRKAAAAKAARKPARGAKKASRKPARGAKKAGKKR
jgi:valyl-tRNA synthetase